MTSNIGYRTRQRTCSPAIFCILVIAALNVVLAGVAHAQEINEYCPVMTEEVADPQITTVHQGKTIAFCCENCMKKFKINPARYLSRLPQFAGTAASEAKNDDHLRNGDDLSHNHSMTEASDERSPWLGRLHPIIIHFPVAGIPLALLGFLIWVLTGKEAFANADIPPLLVGTLASIAAVITGNILHDSLRFSAALHEIVEWHQYVSTTVMVIALCLAGLRIWRWNRLTGRWRWVYGMGLLLTCGLLSITGYLGGSLVFGPDHLAW